MDLVVLYNLIISNILRSGVKIPLIKVLLSYELITFKDDLPLHYYEDIYGG